MKKLPKNWEELLDIKYRWPKKGDRLLRRSDDWSRGVEFTNHPTSRHVHQWDGYMSAGAGLIYLCTQDGFEHERQFVIYPILFNYRHGVELAMKWIIVCYGGRGVGGIEEDHDLWKLWKQCRAIIEEYQPDDHDDADAVEQIIKDFHDLDKAGVSFRYGWGKDGKHIKLPNHMIDLENIRDVMEGVAGFFTGLDGWLDDLQSAGP
jgi:hypothetical protein